MQEMCIHKTIPLITLSTVSQKAHEVLVPHTPNSFDLNFEFLLCLPPDKSRV